MSASAAATRPVILLAGLHKTATSSIQQTCAANLPLLGRAGYSYPVTRTATGATSPNHSAAFHFQFRGDPKAAGLNRNLRMRAPGLSDATARARDNWARMMAGMSGTPLFAAESVSLLNAGELQGMKDWFAGLGWDLRLWCHVRHVRSWLSSIVSQRVTSGPLMTVSGVIAELGAAGGVVRPRLEALLAVFPDMQVRSHEEAVRHRQGPPGYFLENIGMTGIDALRVVRANEGRSDAATRVLSLANGMGFGRYTAEGRENPAMLPDELVARINAIPGPKFSLRPAEAAPLANRIQSENEWLRERFGLAFFDSSTSFTEDARPMRADTSAALAAVLPDLPDAVRVAWEQKAAT